MNFESACGDAFSATSEPSTKGALQAVRQSMPAGEEVTAPLPLPPTLTEREAVATGATAAEMIRAQLPVAVPAEPVTVAVKRPASR